MGWTKRIVPNMGSQAQNDLLRLRLCSLSGILARSLCVSKHHPFKFVDIGFPNNFQISSKKSEIWIDYFRSAFHLSPLWLSDRQRKNCLLHCLRRFSCPSSIPASRQNCRNAHTPRLPQLTSRRSHLHWKGDVHNQGFWKAYSQRSKKLFHLINLCTA